MTMTDPETVGEIVGAVVEEAIADAREEEAVVADTAAVIAAAAMENERGIRIDTIERRFEEWERNQTDTSEAIAALTLGLTELTGQVSALLILQAPPMQNLPDAEDGPRENQEPEIPVAIVEPEAPQVEAPVIPAPRKKKHRWI
jgi:hypothetical protein